MLPYTIIFVSLAVLLVLRVCVARCFVVGYVTHEHHGTFHGGVSAIRMFA